MSEVILSEMPGAIDGYGWAEVFDLRWRRISDPVRFGNKVTDLGDRLYGERGAGIVGLAAPTGMQLGTGITTPSKSGGGAAIGTFLSGSSVALVEAPVSSYVSSRRQIQYRVIWGPGVGTHASLTEVVLHNQSVATNAAAPEANTISRSKFATSLNKPSDAYLIVTWLHLLGTP